MDENGRNKKIAIAAGGTGGHIFPALSLAGVMMEKGYKILFITDENFNKVSTGANAILKSANFSIYNIKITRRRGLIGRAIMALEAFFAIFSIGKTINKYGSKAVVGFGSYVSLPSVIAGFLTRKVTILHEQNSVMGLSNRIGCWFSSVCACGFPRVKKIHPWQSRKVCFTGNPIRKEFTKLFNYSHSSTTELADTFNLSREIGILIMGGSQGASVFKNTVSQSLCLLPGRMRRRIKVYHQAPEAQIAQLQKLYQDSEIRHTVSAFFTNVPELMSLSHLFIGRAGASTIAEIACMGVPSILIPYPIAAHNHQKENALFLQQHGGSVLIEQRNIDIKKLSKTIELLLSSEQELLSMSRNVKELAQPFAAEKLAIAVETGIFGRKISNFNIGQVDILPECNNQH